MKVCLETMGCQMNKLDSELVVCALRAAGHELVEDARQADAVLYNTCSVRRHAEQKALSRLGADGQRKAAGRKLIVGVLGCMAQRMGEAMLSRYPQVNLICAPGQLHRLAELLERAAAGERCVAADPQRRGRAEPSSGDGIESLDLGRDVRRGGLPSQAFVRVMRGCDKFCTYCVVPFVRGPERSRPPDHILQEVRRLVDAGRSEITLLGQTVNSYRWRGGRTSVRFSDLLSMAGAVPGLRRLRFVTSHPVDFGDDVLQAMRDRPNICRYIHVPAQSGSDAVLRRMNRGYARAEYDDLIDRARSILPDVVLAGDFIVGFPGEAEQDHAASADLIRRSGYKNSFIFKYSQRPGTPAAKRFKDDVPAAVKKLRNGELLAVQAEVGLAHHRAYVGKTVEVLVEGPSVRAGKQPVAAAPGCTQLTGRTPGDHIAVFDGRASLAGEYVQVRVTDATSLTLFGHIPLP